MIHLFSSANSFNSILTIEKETKGELSSDSIFQICRDAGLKQVFLIEKNPSSFPQAFKNSKSLELELIVGLEFIICEDMNDKSLESIETEHKVFILSKSERGYKEGLMRMFSDAANQGNFKGIFRTDFKSINNYWSDELVMMIPFYDNFIYKNAFTFSNCLVSLKKYNPFFCLESHSLPLDKIMRKKIKTYAETNSFQTVETHRTFYKNKEDILPYMVYKCIQNKSSIEQPNLTGMCSDEFHFLQTNK